jgi:hypothetical protein
MVERDTPRICRQQSICGLESRLQPVRRAMVYSWCERCRFVLGKNSMRSFIGAMLVIVILSGSARADEEDAVQLIKKLNGKITRQDNDPFGDVIALELHGPNFTDATLKQVKECKRLTTLILNYANVTDAGVKELKGIKRLTTPGSRPSNDAQLLSGL